MKIIDSHQHVFWHGRDDAELVADMDDQGIHSAWLLSWEILPQEDSPTYHKVLNPEHVRPDGTHPGIPLSDLVRCRNRYPERFVLGYCPHPLKEAAPDLLESAVKIHGVRVCGEWKFRLPFDDPRNIRLMRKAGELGLPVVLHLDVPWKMNAEGVPEYLTHWYGGTVDNLERALQACPQTVFIGHAPGFWREIAAEVDESSRYPDSKVKSPGRLYELFDCYPNLYADLSAGSALKALSRDPEHAAGFILRYADRLLFGRDYYGGDLMAFLDTLELPESVLEQICHRNAESLLAGGVPALVG